MTANAFDEKEFGQRFALVVADLGDDSAAKLTGKSSRQLKRYAAGDEPPFGVLKALVEASGATLEWLTYNRPISTKDLELALKYYDQQVRKITKRLSKVNDVADAENLREQMALTRQLMTLTERQLTLARGLARPRQVVVGAAPSTPAVDAALLSRLARVVAETHREARVTLSGEGVAVEAAILYNELASRNVLPSDIDAAISQLRADLAERLAVAAAAPGTGKREAS